MNEHDDQPLRRLLQEALPPLGEAPVRDLWPRMRLRLESASAPWPWLDVALAAAALAALIAFPQAIPWVLLQC